MMIATSLREALRGWITRVLHESFKPTRDVIAFNFGLFMSDRGYVIYLIGSKSFDAEDSDWACIEDYTPDERYLLLPDSVRSTQWNQLLTLVEKELRTILSEDVIRDTFLAEASMITVGFDDGDLIRLK